MRSLVAVLVVGALSLCGGAASAAQKSQTRINLERIINSMDSPQMAPFLAAARSATAESQILEKKVPPKDATSVSLTGTVLETETDFLSDGTPITVGIMNVNLPLHQEIYFSCIGGSIWSQCNSTGRRKLDGFLLAGDGVVTDVFVNLVIVTKLTR